MALIGLKISPVTHRLEEQASGQEPSIGRVIDRQHLEEGMLVFTTVCGDLATQQSSRKQWRLKCGLTVAHFASRPGSKLCDLPASSDFDARSFAAQIPMKLFTQVHSGASQALLQFSANLRIPTAIDSAGLLRARSYFQL